MKTKDENFTKKIKLNKLKIAALSRDEKRQISGGLLWTWLACPADLTNDTIAN